MNTIEQRVNEIKEDLDFFEDELSKYEYIIDLGKKLEEFNEADKIPANIVHGCTSQVWLTHEIKDGKMFFHGTSDAIIVKGLVYMILKIFSNSTIQELKDIDIKTIIITFISGEIIGPEELLQCPNYLRSGPVFSCA